MTDHLDVEECELDPTIWVFAPGRSAPENDIHVPLRLGEDWFIIDHYIAIMEPLERGNEVEVKLNITAKAGRFAETRPGSGVSMASPTYTYEIKEPRPMGILIDFHEDLADWEFADLLRKRYPKP